MTTETRDPHELDEDGFHEIQLSGKQLVFLCMATTVVSIVIFLCGVLVGRGVRPVEPVAEAAAVTSTEPVPVAPEPLAPAPAAPAPNASAANAAPAPANRSAAAQSAPQPTPDLPPADEHGTAATAKPAAVNPASRFVASPGASASSAPAAAKPAEPAPTRPEPVKEATTAAAARTAPPPVADAPPARPAEPTPAEAPASAASAKATSGNGAIAVQVGAMKEKGDAEALARHLSGKGYAVYIVQPVDNAPNPVYRVRVGNYTSQDEAARVKRRLEQEEKLKPWITR